MPPLVRSENDQLLRLPQLHMETEHPEGGESPFVVKDDASIAAVLSLNDDEEVQYASCPVDGCGEAILLTELDSHIEMHTAEEQDTDHEFGESASRGSNLEDMIKASFDTKLSHALRNLNDDERSIPVSHTSDRQATAKAVWKSLLRMPDTGSKAFTTKGTRRRLGVRLLPASLLS